MVPLLSYKFPKTDTRHGFSALIPQWSSRAVLTQQRGGSFVAEVAASWQNKGHAYDYYSICLGQSNDIAATFKI